MTRPASPLLRTFLAFAGVGAIATAAQYAILAFLVEVLGAPPAASSALGFAVSAFGNYLLNHRYTFRSTAAHRVALPKFLVASGAGLVLNTALMALLAERLRVPYLLAQVATTAVVLGWNFTASVLWSFRDRPACPREGGVA